MRLLRQVRPNTTMGSDCLEFRYCARAERLTATTWRPGLGLSKRPDLMNSRNTCIGRRWKLSGHFSGGIRDDRELNHNSRDRGADEP